MVLSALAPGFSKPPLISTVVSHTIRDSNGSLQQMVGITIGFIFLLLLGTLLGLLIYAKNPGGWFR